MNRFFFIGVLGKIEKGKCVYESPSVLDIKEFSKIETDKLWSEVLRFENPHTYYVDLSQKLWDIKHDMLRKGRKG